MSQGRKYESEVDAFLGRAVEMLAAEGVPRPDPFAGGKEWARPSAEVTDTYPKLDIPQLIATIEQFRERGSLIDDQLLDALVDIVNRSPFPVPQWAESLGVPLPEFVDICHRGRPVSESFREKVRVFFDRWRGKPNPTWDELRPFIKSPAPLPRKS